MKTKTVMSVAVPPALHEALKQIAALEDTKLSPLVVKVLEKFVEEYQS